ncbi:hypothetical protein H8Z60_10435 [Mycolicibacterium fortuitum]|uniref:hypothetical protein n=1 Tax=Mycolicibacterium fortuitum TaxID=1766 RepID=UPI001CE0730B|nr:hypothetical protein [Mycolicibacterium fortuitum]MCA4752946.1 hypothetical protein [Mycolicibacterium fortuitum]WAY22809.1 hypothetical protein OF855_17670 [Mycolicibacterium fortuitum]
MLRDIRDLTEDPEAYAAELRRRWGGLLSYRYLGRSYSSMDLGLRVDTQLLPGAGGTVAVRATLHDEGAGKAVTAASYVFGRTQ